MSFPISRTLLLSAASLLLLAAAPARLAAADTYEVDVMHSWVTFKVKHMGIGYALGMINIKSGTVVVDEADPSKSSIELVLDPGTIYTGIPKRDDHLKGADFFNAKEFPAITFKSTAVKGDAKEADVSGELTLLGVTKPVEAEVDEIGKGKGMKGEDLRGAEAKFKFKRSDFGMKFGLDNGALADEVEVYVIVEGKKK
jgi:polyisoprenoid-binding protein YceI